MLTTNSEDHLILALKDKFKPPSIEAFNTLLKTRYLLDNYYILLLLFVLTLIRLSYIGNL